MVQKALHAQKSLVNQQQINHHLQNEEVTPDQAQNNVTPVQE